MRVPARLIVAAFGWALLAGSLLGCRVVAGGGGGGGDTCRATSECAGDLECQGPSEPHACGIPPRMDCASVSTCGAGLQCHAIADACSPSGVGSTCGVPCTSDCGAGFRCNDQGACEPTPCDEGQACAAHQQCDVAVAHAQVAVYSRTSGCVSVPCAADSDCATATACVNGVCQAGPGTCVEVIAVP